MTGQNAPKPPPTGLPQAAELEYRLETTRERLQQASSQLVILPGLCSFQPTPDTLKVTGTCSMNWSL
jgi:hypothetical protein